MSQKSLKENSSNKMNKKIKIKDCEVDCIPIECRALSGTKKWFFENSNHFVYYKGC